MEKIPEIKDAFRGSCLGCPGTENRLSMSEVLYQGFGGYHVEKDGAGYYTGEQDGVWESFKTLADIEKDASKSPLSDWRVILNSPLRGATWQRHEKDTWVLIETNLGFA